jgi:acyl-[acyl-carrier-protein]-phospholipid O-acyltransferase/long-chain-fatty-acid--[acyl-carrier-protein] ligase
MAPHTYRETLRRPGLQPFLWTQFLGAFNDNLFKIVVSIMAVHLVAADRAGRELSIVSYVFIAPFLLFSGYAGDVADVYSKRTVLVVSKSLEIVAAGLGLVAFAFGHLQLTYVVLFLIALQATFFSPAKYGILPEMLPDGDLSRANGVLEMSTFVAIVLGTAVGGYLFDVWHDHLWLIGVLVVAVAIVGTASSFRIPRVPAAAAGRRLDWSPWGEIWKGVQELRRDRVLWLTVVGISYFWFLGSLLQLVVILFGSEVMHLGDTWVGVLTAFAAIGIGAGSLLAGRLSGDKVELGLAPIGSIGMGLFAIALARSGHSFLLAAINLTIVGLFGGFFAVPLNALLQQRSGADTKGRLMATNSFLNMVAIAMASGALWLFTTVFKLSADRILLVFGALTLVSSIYVLSIVPEFLIRFSLWLLTHTIYRIEISGQEHVPSRGPALLVCNHMSHVDGLLVGSCVQRFIRFLVYKPYYEYWAFRPLLKLMKAIPIAAGREALASIEQAKRELQNGHVVCIFAEGSISRTGNLLPFKRGFERIVEGLDVPIVPVYLDRVWGSIFSFKGGRFFWKWPVRIPYPVTVAFGAPLAATTGAAHVRHAIQTLGCNLAMQRRRRDESIGRQFVRTAKHHWGSFGMADPMTKPMTFGRVLVASLLLSRWARRRLTGESNIGVLLPASVGGALANLGVSMSGKVPVNLNFTAGPESMAMAIERAGIKTIISSRKFLSKAGIELPQLQPPAPGPQPPINIVFLEDVLKEFGTAAKVGMLITARFLPSWVINRFFIDHVDGDALATIIFSSGSTGTPKGVMLTHRNILANVDGIGQVYTLAPKDVMLGVLPFFHSFGFTGTLCFPMISGFGVVYHANPMDAKTIGELAGKYRATLIISTPTFCSSYVRKCEREQFAHLRIAIVGAERLREPIAAAFKEKFGIDLLEGYGCTEMAPVVAVNVPNVQDGRERQQGTRVGTVGHPLPGIAAMIVDPTTGEGPLFDQEGLLLVKGPNRMLGYLGQPEKTAEVVRDGWYVTGDIALIDDSGFVRITDRLSRFSKIGGEMVPHMRVEEQLQALIDEHHTVVVTSVPDDVKGERLVALYTDPDIAPRDLWERVNETELPRLWIPKREDLRFVESIPTLGTGKVNLRAVRQIAIDIAASAV